MAVIDSYEALTALTNRLNNPKPLLDSMFMASASEAKRLLGIEFQQGINPFQQAWAPLKGKKKNRRPLRKTGRMGNSFTAKPISNGIRVGNNTKYVGFQNDGTNGRKTAQTRYQPVNKRGRFQKKSAAARMKKLVKVRRLGFQAGTGGIPARMMIPPNGVFSPWWQQNIDRACGSAFDKYWQGRQGL